MAVFIHIYSLKFRALQSLLLLSSSPFLLWQPGFLPSQSWTTQGAEGLSVAHPLGSPSGPQCFNTHTSSRPSILLVGPVGSDKAHAPLT